MYENCRNIYNFYTFFGGAGILCLESIKIMFCKRNSWSFMPNLIRFFYNLNCRECYCLPHYKLKLKRLSQILLYIIFQINPDSEKIVLRIVRSGTNKTFQCILDSRHHYYVNALKVGGKKSFRKEWYKKLLN